MEHTEHKLTVTDVALAVVFWCISFASVDSADCWGCNRVAYVDMEGCLWEGR